ncbi:MAG: hypothetical protein KF802_04240 [Bdellovibrionaceae bacterium]|nr:hypothetical protein [Pseudobdellovibrionaceae bacterium]
MKKLILTAVLSLISAAALADEPVFIQSNCEFGDNGPQVGFSVSRDLLPVGDGGHAIVVRSTLKVANQDIPAVGQKCAIRVRVGTITGYSCVHQTASGVRYEIAPTINFEGNNVTSANIVVWDGNTPSAILRSSKCDLAPTQAQ